MLGAVWEKEAKKYYWTQFELASYSIQSVQTPKAIWCICVMVSRKGYSAPPAEHTIHSCVISSKSMLRFTISGSTLWNNEE